jgi:hypothetical protein
MMPGRTLHRLAARICSPESLERIVEPAIADLQSEYAHAVASGAHVRRAKALLSGYTAVLEVMIMCALQEPSAMNGERHAIVRTLLWALAMTVCTSAVVVALTLAIVPGIPPFYVSLMAALVLPIAIPVGVTLAIAFALRDGSISRRTTRALAATTVIAMAVSVGAMVSNVPVASQSFRQQISDALGGRAAVVKAATELSAAAVQQQEAFAPPGGRAGWPRRHAWTQHLLLAIPFAMPVLALFAGAVVHRGAPRKLVMGACVLYFTLVPAGEQLVHQGMPAFAAAWLANALTVVAALVVLKCPAASSDPRAL